MRQYRRDHPEKFAAASKRYRAKPEAQARQREQKAEWRQKNKGRVKAANRRYVQKNPLKMADRKAAWLERKAVSLTQGKPKGSFSFSRRLPPLPPRPIPGWILAMDLAQMREWYTQYRGRFCGLRQDILERKIADATAYSATPVAPSPASAARSSLDRSAPRNQ